MRAVSLHRDVIVVTSRVWQTTSTIVRGPAPGTPESFVIDSPIYPDELEILPTLIQQAGFAFSGLLVTHADWDHLLARLAFPDAALGCAETTAARLAAEPGAAARALRDFDDEHYVTRPRPLTLGSVQALPVPGRCELAGEELELHPAGGHTVDGMAISIPWAGVLVAGDYLSPAEIPTFAEGSASEYAATLQRLRPLVADAEHVVPGHGQVLDRPRALRVLDEDAAYVAGLLAGDADTPLPRAARSATQRRRHAENVEALALPA
jgi:glyoxylase-like metal-dependent hydrolase (beta-lactamase superfamily II)